MNIDMKKIFDCNKTKEEQLIYYYLAYSSEEDEVKKMMLLKKIQELKEGNHQDE